MPDSTRLRRKVALFREYSREIEAIRKDGTLSWDEKYELVAMIRKERSKTLDASEQVFFFGRNR